MPTSLPTGAGGPTGTLATSVGGVPPPASAGGSSSLLAPSRSALHGGGSGRPVRRDASPGPFKGGPTGGGPARQARDRSPGGALTTESIGSATSAGSGIGLGQQERGRSRAFRTQNNIAVMSPRAASTAPAVTHHQQQQATAHVAPAVPGTIGLSLQQLQRGRPPAVAPVGYSYTSRSPRPVPGTNSASSGAHTARGPNRYNFHATAAGERAAAESIHHATENFAGLNHAALAAFGAASLPAGASSSLSYYASHPVTFGSQPGERGNLPTAAALATMQQQQQSSGRVSPGYMHRHAGGPPGLVDFITGHQQLPPLLGHRPGSKESAAHVTQPAIASPPPAPPVGKHDRASQTEAAANTTPAQTPVAVAVHAALPTYVAPPGAGVQSAIPTSALTAIVPSIPAAASGRRYGYELAHMRLLELHHPSVYLDVIEMKGDEAMGQPHGDGDHVLALRLDGGVEEEEKTQAPSDRPRSSASKAHLSPRHHHHHDVTLSPMSSPLRSFEDQLSSFYANLGNWDEFDIFQLYDLTDGWPLSFLFMMIDKKHHFLAPNHIDPVTAFHFIQEVESNYLPNNPYHHAVHAADVVHAAFHLVEHTPLLKGGLSAFDCLVLYTSCAIHDFQHPGTCFDEDTRLLTSEGFLWGDEIKQRLDQPESTATPTLQFACYDPETESIVYRACVGNKLSVDFIPAGPTLVEFGRAGEGWDQEDGDEEATGVSLRVTPNHTMYAQWADKSSLSGPPSPFTSSLPADGGNLRGDFFLPASERAFHARAATMGERPDEFRMMGLAAAGRTTSKEEQERLLEEIGVQGDELLGFLEAYGHHLGLASNSSSPPSTPPVLAGWAKTLLNAEQLRAVLRGLARASGCARGNCIVVSDAAFRDDLQVAALHAGYSCRVTRQSAADGLGWELVFTDASSSASLPRLRSSTGVRSVPYDGRVWCVTVDHPAHLVIAQRATRTRSKPGAASVVLSQSRPVIVGQSNAFLVNSRAPLALRYNDRSVLECLEEGSLIRTCDPDRPTMRVEDLRDADVALGLHLKGQVGPVRLQSVHHAVVSHSKFVLTDADGRTYAVTPNHRVTLVWGRDPQYATTTKVAGGQYPTCQLTMYLKIATADRAVGERVTITLRYWPVGGPLPDETDGTLVARASRADDPFSASRAVHRGTQASAREELEKLADKFSLFRGDVLDLEAEELWARMETEFRAEGPSLDAGSGDSDLVYAAVHVEDSFRPSAGGDEPLAREKGVRSVKIDSIVRLTRGEDTEQKKEDERPKAWQQRRPVGPSQREAAVAPYRFVSIEVGGNHRFVLGDGTVTHNSFHVSSAFRMMHYQQHCNILGGFSFQEYSKIRKSLIDLVLATDLAVHFELMGAFKRKINQIDIVASDEDRLMIMQIILKCGDLSHPARSRRLHLKWSELVTEEFFCQGDRERVLNLPPSMFMDRHTTSLPQSQIGFITFLVYPMFQAYNLFSSRDYWARKVEENLEWWHEVARVEAEEKKLAAERLERGDDDNGDEEDGLSTIGGQSEPNSATGSGSAASSHAASRRQSMDNGKMPATAATAAAAINSPKNGGHVATTIGTAGATAASSAKLPSSLDASLTSAATGAHGAKTVTFRSPELAPASAPTTDLSSEGELSPAVVASAASSHLPPNLSISPLASSASSSAGSQAPVTPSGTARSKGDGSSSSTHFKRTTSKRRSTHEGKTSAQATQAEQEDLALLSETAQVAALSAAGASAAEAKEHQEEEQASAAAAAAAQTPKAGATLGLMLNALPTSKRKSVMKGVAPPASPLVLHRNASMRGTGPGSHATTLSLSGGEASDDSAGGGSPPSARGLALSERRALSLTVAASGSNVSSPLQLSLASSHRRASMTSPLGIGVAGETSSRSSIASPPGGGADGIFEHAMSRVHGSPDGGPSQPPPKLLTHIEQLELSHGAIYQEVRELASLTAIELSNAQLTAPVPILSPSHVGPVIIPEFSKRAHALLNVVPRPREVAPTPPTPAKK